MPSAMIIDGFAKIKKKIKRLELTTSMKNI